MHLNRQILAGVDKLHKQWEVVAEFLIYLLAYNQLLVFVNQFYKSQALIDIIDKTAIYCHALMSWHAADFPTLANIGLSVKNTFEWCNLITAPDGGL